MGYNLNRLMGGGLALYSSGTGQTTSSFTVGMSLNNVFSSPTSGGDFVAGIPLSANPRTSRLTKVPGDATKFTSGNFVNNNEFLAVKGYDYDGVGGFTAADAPLVYMDEMVWTITRKDGLAFASDTLFVFSMDGQQYSNITNVPEPSSSLLIASSIIGACFFRRRRASSKVS